MATENNPRPSFSLWRKWQIGLHVSLLLLLVLAVVVMVNYLSRDFYYRFHFSTRNQIELSPLSLKLIQSVTNRLQVTVFYDKSDPMYSTVAALLNQYQRANSKISIETVDYLRDPGAAQKVKTTYKLTSAADKNLVIFDCEGRIKTVDGNGLVEVTLEQVPNDKEMELRRKPVAFRGEVVFSSVLFALTNPKPLKAYCLQGHGEHAINGTEERNGYAKFASVLQQNYLLVEPLSLLGTNPVPADCSLLIIPGPTGEIFPLEADKISQYLDQGGRLLALFNANSIRKRTGLEKLLEDWGVTVGNFVVRDPENSTSGEDVVVGAFGKHPLVNPLLGYRVQLFRPRPVKANPRALTADAPRVEELMFSGRNAFSERNPEKGHLMFAFAVAIEKGAIKGVITERGSTRIVVVGESLFLANNQIEAAANRDFAATMVNWLLDRTQLLQGLGPRPIIEHRLLMTESQLRTARWILLAAMPGAILLVGALVWFRRRK